MWPFLVSALLVLSVPPPVAAGESSPQPPAGSSGADASYYFLLGRHLESSGRIDEAVAAHKRAIELDPGSAELRAELAGMLARQNNAPESVVQAEAALERDPSNAEAHRLLGMAYAEFADRKLPLKLGDDPSTYNARAIASLEKARAGGPDIGLEVVLGQLYLQTGQFSKSVPLLTRVVESQPDSVDAAVLLSTAQESAGEIEAAVATLEALLREQPSSYRAQIRIAEIRESKEQWRQAADAYGKAQAINPRAPLTSRRAVALLSAGRPAEARDVVQGALASGRTEAKEPVLLYLLAESQRVLQDLDEAQKTVQKLLAAHPGDARGLHVLSLIFQDKGDLKGAERTLRELLTKDPLDANALNSLGYMLAERGERLDEAVALLQRALKIEPGNPSYLDSLGWAYLQQGRLDLADSPLTEAAAKLGTNSVVQDHLGDLRFKQQRWSDAAAAWEKALAGDGQSIDRARVEKKLREARGRM
jgi:tetratricopeptide (TPR) repeat protein